MDDQGSSSLVAWILAGVSAVVSALAITVAKLFHINLGENKELRTQMRADIEELKDRAKQCEEDRHTLYGTCQKLEGKLEEIERRMK